MNKFSSDPFASLNMTYPGLLGNIVFQLSSDCKSSIRGKNWVCIFELNQQNAVGFDIVKIANLDFIDEQSLMVDDETVVMSSNTAF